MSYSLAAGTQAEVRQRSIISQVYLWMTLGLAVTGSVAAFTATSPFMRSLVFGNVFIFFGIFVVQIILVIALGAAIMRMSVGTATALFLLYAVLMGLSLSGIFLEYTKASLASTFFITGGTFGIMGLYGYTTKRDLTKIRNLALMALIGLILASLVNIFLHSEIIYWITTYLGILIFVGLIAADTQKIKRMSAQASGENGGRLAILGALMLYLDFINLFLFLLRIFGNSNNS